MKANISLISYLWKLGCRSWNIFLFSVIVFDLMKLLAILLQVKVDQNYDFKFKLDSERYLKCLYGLKCL